MKTDVNSKFRKQFEADKAVKIENETIRRYQIYFRPDTVEDKLSNIKRKLRQLMLNILHMIIELKKLKLIDKKKH